MSENPTRPYTISEASPAPEGTAEAGRYTRTPTLDDEFLESVCTLGRGRIEWSPGPGHSTEDLPWLKGAAAA